MQPTKELIDELFLDKVRQARNTPPVERLLNGARLFDFSCRIMCDGIRHQHPDAGPEEVKRLLFERIALSRKLESMP